MALSEQRTRHRQTDYMVRAKLFAGLRDRRMAMGSILDDEKLKLAADLTCAYCSSSERLTVDHLIARKWGGGDDGANLVRACRSCNSSKRDRDLLDWYAERGDFPPLMVYRRYLKLLAARLDDAALMDVSLDDDRLAGLSIDVSRLPTSLPPLSELRL